MLLAAAAVAVASWVPMRWDSKDPASLTLLDGSPVNCLLLESKDWSAAFSARARERGVITLGVVHGALDLKAARAAELDGLVAEGADVADAGGLPVYRITRRQAMAFQGPDPIAATFQGVWSGINAVDDGKARAAPSGAPWIDTNAGFLRFARTLTSKPVWIAHKPPPGATFPVTRYLQAAAEAAMCGARWVIALDTEFQGKLLARNGTAVRDWKRLNEELAFIEKQRPVMGWNATGNLSLIQDAENGALLSGGILDMIAVKHTPVRPIPMQTLSKEMLMAAPMAVNADPGPLTRPQRDILDSYTKAGGTLLSGAREWSFPEIREGEITLDEKEVTKLDAIWKEVNALTGRRNLGARLFNVGSMLSNLTASPDGKRLALHLVNYTDFPVEAITIHLLGTWKKATLHQPGAPPKAVETYLTQDGLGADIASMGTYAILEVE